MYTPFSENNIQIDQQDVKSDQRINQQLNTEDALRKQQEQQATQKAATDLKQTQAALDPKTGRPKSSFEVLNPKQFGLAENAQEALNAVGGGAVDAANSFLALPKVFDPKFYEAGNDYKPPFLQIEKPITRTVWGGLLRNVTELIILSKATGKLAGGGSKLAGKAGPMGQAVAKPLTYLNSTRTTRAGRVVQSAVLGATADVVSNQSQDNNAAAALIQLKPEWASVLKPIATNDSMSPAQRSLMNIGEGLGIGGAVDLALEAGGAALRATVRRPKPSTPPNPEMVQLQADRQLESVQKMQADAYEKRGKRLEGAARVRLERAAHRTEKSQLVTDETFTEWQKRNNAAGSSPWMKLDDAERQRLTVEEAKKTGADWGPERNFELRATRQADQGTDVAVDRLTRDEVTPDDAFVYEGSTPERGQVLSAERDPIAALHDHVTIQKDLTQAEGTPRSVLTEANIRRIEVGAPGMSVEEVEKLSNFYAADKDFQKTYGQAAASSIKEDLLDVQNRVNEFLDDSGNFRGTPVSEEQIIDFFGTFGNAELSGPKFGGNIGEGREILNKSQLMANDVLVGTLLKQVRDVARAANSVSDQIDILDADSLGDLIFSRISALARLRKETSMINSYNLRMMSAGKSKNASKDLDFMTELTDASDAEVAKVAAIKQALRADTSDALLNTYVELLATAGDKITTFKDLHSFLTRKLHGYTDGDTVQKGAILAELQSMYVHSVLSGPRTVTRTIVGTGLSTIMRPVATIIGSAGDYLKGEDQVTRGAFAGINAMQESLSEAWSLAKQRWAGQITGDTPSVKSITDQIEANNIKDLEWEAMGNYVKQFGSDGDKSAYFRANMIRAINKFPLLNYSTRAMAATDQFFGHLLGRARVRQLAFNEAYDTLKQAKGVVSDADARELTRLYESKFEAQVWSADGQVNDVLLKRAQEEVSLTQDLRGWAADFERGIDKAPYLKPFMLFTKTAYNALELTAKYAPGLNRFITEVDDIRRLAWDDPKMLTYGIKSPEDHAAMKALTEGRVALGYATVATASTLFLNGMITGNGPAEKQLRDTWTQAGWKPRSLKIGDKYVSYDALEPFNSFLSMVADIGDASHEMGDNWTMTKFGQLGFILASNITNKSFLTGIVQLNDFLSFKGAKPLATIANISNNQLPWGGMRNEIGKLLSPGMRELDNGIANSLRNRNLYTDLFTGPDNKLPYRYDILNGTKINDHDFMTRAFNAVSPFQMNLGSTPTRELFFRSGIDAKTTFNTGPNGEVLTPKMKSKYQYLIGQQNLEAQLGVEFQNPQMLQSILNMEADRAANRPYTVDETLHGSRIKSLIDNAKKQAWTQLVATDDSVGKLTQQQAVRTLSKKARQSGDTERANELLKMANK